MSQVKSIVSSICRAVGLGMGAAVIVLGILGVTTAEAGVKLCWASDCSPSPWQRFNQRGNKQPERDIPDRG